MTPKHVQKKDSLQHKAKDHGIPSQAGCRSQISRRVRADMLTVAQGLAESRSRAQALILAGGVLQKNGQRISKPGAWIPAATQLQLKDQPLPYVSRGGVKLAAALGQFGISVQDHVCLDVGASTGGFTDCLLQQGARRVHAVDVGYGQLAWRLRHDPRVVLHERCNIRTAPATLLGEKVSRVVVDVSFISVKLILKAVVGFLSPEAILVALVKPQFEVGRSDVGKGGIVRSTAARQAALTQVGAAVASWGFTALRSMASPLLGAKGNHEFLLTACWTPCEGVPHPSSSQFKVFEGGSLSRPEGAVKLFPCKPRAATAGRSMHLMVPRSPPRVTMPSAPNAGACFL